MTETKTEPRESNAKIQLGSVWVDKEVAEYIYNLPLFTRAQWRREAYKLVMQAELAQKAEDDKEMKERILKEAQTEMTLDGDGTRPMKGPVEGEIHGGPKQEMTQDMAYGPSPQPNPNTFTQLEEETRDE